MRLLTNSMRRKFSACPRAHQFAYVMMRRPLHESDALAFGSLIHRALEAWWSHEPEHRRLAALHSVASEAENGADPYTMATARALIEGYDREYRSQDLEAVLVETEFKAPLMNPETGGVSKTWILSGKIDAIAKEPSGRLVIVEHKTTSSDLDPTSDYWPKLAIDGQVSGYYLGAKAIGYDVEDCVYDVIRKPSLRPYKATPADKIQYKKDGTPYAGTRLADETPEEWESRLLADIEERPDRYFARKRVARLESDMQDYLFDMWAVGRNIADSERLGRFSRNPDSCSGFGTCEYFPVCSGMASITDDTMFKTLETEHPELSPEQAALEAAFKE